MYVYGHKNFTNDIHQMTGVRPGLYWQLTWRLIAPALITILVITSVINQFKEHPKYDAYRVEIVSMTLCSRNFQNVKLRLDFFEV